MLVGGSIILASSYTALWLESLLKPANRLRTDCLSELAVVGSGRYEVLDQIGSGGQGTAYRARAITDIHGELKAGDVIVLKEFVIPADVGIKVSRRMLNNISREAELLKALNHRSIIKLLDFFVEDQRTYLVLNYIAGNSLRKVVETNGRLSESQVISFAGQMCEILTYLHSQTPPVVHRDFTPKNLILDATGKLTLIDFNVAQQLEANKTNTVVGKHSYIPIEQFRGEATTQSDIYALGATMFYLLTGKNPEPISTSHPKASVPGLSTEIEYIVARATEQDAHQRYANALSLQQDLMDTCS